MKKTWSTWTDSRKPFLPLINNNGKNYGTILRHSKKFMEKYGTHGTFLGNYLPLVNNHGKNYRMIGKKHGQLRNLLENPTRLQIVKIMCALFCFATALLTV